MLTTTEDSFNADVLAQSGLVLVDFWAPWCGPCRAIAPILDELADHYGEKLTIAKVNVDDNGPLAARYGVRSIPTLMLFRDREALDTMIGALPKTDISARVDRFLSSTSTAA